jgi:Peptidase M15
MTTIIIPGISRPVALTDPIYAGSNFTWGEATRNGERMPQRTIFDGEIVSALSITGNIIKLAHELDRVRSLFGDRPVRVTSWLRPPAINKAVGGVVSSQHLLGWAADILVDGYSPSYVAKQLKESWPGGLGDSAAFTHLDLRHLLDGGSSAYWNYGNA